MGTVRAELALPLENQGEAPAAVARAVEEAALALGIAHLLDRPTAELSGGELQRVALGAALAGRPKLILLDEPTSQLDPVAGDELIALLRRLNEDFDAAIVIAEHRLERCLGVRRPGDRDARRARGVRRRPGRVPRVGVRGGARAGDARARGCCPASGLGPVAGVKAARVGPACPRAAAGPDAGEPAPTRPVLGHAGAPQTGARASTGSGTRSIAVRRSCAASRSRSAPASASR